jgi:hypothetical protein
MREPAVGLTVREDGGQAQRSCPADTAGVNLDRRCTRHDRYQHAGLSAYGLGRIPLRRGWETLDPLIALAVAANIVLTGVRLMRRSAAGLMDRALPAEELTEIQTVLDLGDGLRPEL